MLIYGPLAICHGLLDRAMACCGQGDYGCFLHDGQAGQDEKLTRPVCAGLHGYDKTDRGPGGNRGVGAGECSNDGASTEVRSLPGD